MAITKRSQRDFSRYILTIYFQLHRNHRRTCFNSTLINPRNSKSEPRRFNFLEIFFFQNVSFDIFSFFFIYLLYFLISFPSNQSQLQLIRYFNESGSTYDALNTCSFSSFRVFIYLYYFYKKLRACTPYKPRP